MKTATQLVIAIETTREGNTHYAFTDSGEMIASSTSKTNATNALANAIGWALDGKGIAKALVNGRLMTTDELKATA